MARTVAVPSLEEALKQLPTSKVHIGKDGRVWKVESWTLWNSVPCCTVEITRTGDKFTSDIGDPEHGGCQKTGTLGEVVAGLHPKFRAQYQKLFALQNPAQAQVAEAGFERYEIMRPK